jgi:hypothetical protein
MKTATVKSETPTMSSRWTNYALGIVLALLVLAVLWVPLKELMWWLANRPEVGDAFRDPKYGREDAWISLIAFVLLTPFVGLLMVWALAFLYALPAGYALPFGRKFGVPEWVSTIFVVAASISVLYSQSDVWLAPVLRGLGLVARAWLTVIY